MLVEPGRERGLGDRRVGLEPLGNSKGEPDLLVRRALVEHERETAAHVFERGHRGLRSTLLGRNGIKHRSGDACGVRIGPRGVDNGQLEPARPSRSRASPRSPMSLAEMTAGVSAARPSYQSATVPCGIEVDQARLDVGVGQHGHIDGQARFADTSLFGHEAEMVPSQPDQGI